ncbi:MAG: helix-turn-helix domain-containing protein [Mycobacterium sp.]|nr:helix-turn-helix domain-containing protein [Mycobacterium sp.]
MRVAVLLTEGAFDSGVSTVCDIFNTANDLRDHLDGPMSPWEVSLVAARRTVRTANGHRIATAALASPAPDILVVTAFKGPGPIADALARPSQRWATASVASARAAGTALAAACTGTFLLAEAGMLDGQRATTSWWLAPEFRRRYPAVSLDDSAALVRSGTITTAGAAFAHIDLALSIVQHRSPALADAVARYLLIGPRASQASFAAPFMLARNDPVLVAFEQWARAHLAEPTSIAAAANAAGVSERTLQRKTKALLGISPAGFINQIRLEEATHLLRTNPTLSADAVAARVGLQHGSTLSALLRRRLATTLGALRRASAASGHP